MEPKREPIGIATFERLSRDLYWTYWHEGERVSWSGYDDAYWWDRVSTTEQSSIRTLKSGKKLRVDFKTNAVFEVA
jgi:hypothetical protein